MSFDASGKQLHVYPPRPLKAGRDVEVRIRYRTTPRRGLYFIGPDAAHPTRPLQAWSQGQDEDSRFWFPCLDSPAQKCPTDVTATFPAKMTSLSNGQLVSDTKKGQRRTMHWRLEQPHSPYLVTLVVGEFEVFEERWRDLTLRTLFEPGRKDDALRCVGRTPKMMEMFERLTGAPYPWGDYSQVFVSEFIFGGMENTSATTLTDAVLHDARAHLDYSAEYLIAHELAHQWFGDLLTCRDWPHGWLNEGFATYGEVLWKEEADGVDEADHNRAVDLETYLGEVSERYARAMVARSFDEPIDLFDHHLYEKGALVLHELRSRLGTGLFEKVVRAYVAKHRHQSVETVDLARTVEDVSGRNFDQFFDEYVFRPGHPAVSVAASFDAGKQRLTLQVKQTGDVFHFTLPVTLEVQDKLTQHAFTVSGKEHTFTVPLKREPTFCLVDAHRDLLATLDVTKPLGWWCHEVKRAPVARARSEAAAALGKDGSAQAVAALSAALFDETAFWGAREACAKALAKVRSPAAKAALLKALTVKHPKARRAVVAALGHFRADAAVGDALVKLCAKGDKSYFVEGEAARSLGRIRDERAFETLKGMMTRPAFVDSIRVGAIDGLAELQDPRGWKTVVDALSPGKPMQGRRAAALALAKLAEVADKKTEAVDRLTQLLRDPSFRVRLGAIDAAHSLGDERLVGPLSSTPFLDGREVRAAREAVRALRGKSPAKELQTVRGELEMLKAEVRALKENPPARRAKPR